MEVSLGSEIRIIIDEEGTTDVEVKIEVDIEDSKTIKGTTNNKTQMVGTPVVRGLGRGVAIILLSPHLVAMLPVVRVRTGMDNILITSTLVNDLKTTGTMNMMTDQGVVGTTVDPGALSQKTPDLLPRKWQDDPG